MEIALITGSAGLVGAEAVRFFSKKRFKVVGIDNDMRKVFFGEEASTDWSRKNLEDEIPEYIHYDVDIRDENRIVSLFREYGTDIKIVIHTAGQPSHDWAAKDPFTDFTVNANGTLILLENTRQYCPDACFIFTSTNKVYGDTPNSLPFIELENRWELSTSHPFHEKGINEYMTIDKSKHSLFGASKVAADILVQEYGHYFDLKTVCFRCGCITGSGHSGTMLHGFLSYLMKCGINEDPYIIYGYKGKQVRDNIHSYDLVNMFWYFYQNPRKGEVYNAGGSRHCNCSVLEGITLCEEIAGKKMNYSYTDTNRSGDHIWWISDISKFQSHYPEWSFHYDLHMIIEELHRGLVGRV